MHGTFLGGTYAEARRRAELHLARPELAGHVVLSAEWDGRLGSLSVTYAAPPRPAAPWPPLTEDPWSTAPARTTAGPWEGLPRPIAWPGPPATTTPVEAPPRASAPSGSRPRPAGQGSSSRSSLLVVVLALIGMSAAGAALGLVVKGRAPQRIAVSAVSSPSLGPSGAGGSDATAPAAVGSPASELPSSGASASPRPPSLDADGRPVPRFETAACRGSILAGRGVECGDLVVYEDRGRVDSKTIRLHVAIYRSWREKPRPDPVLYLDGGPGGAPLVAGFVDEPFLVDRDLIVFDQRGAGYSSPALDCPEQEDLLATDTVLGLATAVRECRDRLSESGIDLAAYTSAESAADVTELRAALRYRSWNLYGISYGSRLALTVLRDHPAGIRSVVLDGVYPPHVDIFAETPQNAQRAFDELFRACARDAACRRAYPSLEADFYALVERLDSSPEPLGRPAVAHGLPRDLEVSGALVLEFLFDRLYVTELIPELPAALTTISDGDYEPIAEWLALTAELGAANNRVGVSGYSEGLHYSVQCAEELPFGPPSAFAPADPGVRREVDDHFRAYAMRAACRLWDVPERDARENEPVVSDVPALLLTGAFDPITPPRWAESAAASLANARLFRFPAVGHGAAGSDDCADRLVTAFLEAPRRAPRDACMQRLAAPRFTTP